MSAELSRRALAIECLVASVSVLALLTLVKHLAFLSLFAEHGFTIAAAFQLFVPIMLIGRRGITSESLGFVSDDWPRDVALALALGLLTIIPFAIGHHYWQTLMWGRAWSPALPDDLAISVVNQVLAVALPEELYFRGYLQSRMEALWPARRRLFGAMFGKALVISCGVFALAHFVGEYNLARLGPFFPALVFGLLRGRTGRITAAVTYHAFCNVLSQVLAASYG